MEVSAVNRFVLDGRIVWTMTTSGYTRYTLNLLTWLRTVAKVPWTLCIVCCDDGAEAFFRRHQIPYVSWKEPGRRVQDGMAAFGTPSFEKCNKQKLSMLEWFSKNYSSCGITHSLYLDGDIVVRKDVWPLLLKRFEETKVNILFQCECFTVDSHEDQANCGVICSGVIATHHSSGSNLYTFEHALWEASEKQDQPYIAKRLELTATPFAMLSRRDFGNGAWQKSGKWRDYDWCLLHYNYFVSGSKRTAMQKENHWII